MEAWPVSYREFGAFFLILIRVSVILFMFPFFSARIIPILPKAGLALVTAIILFPVIRYEGIVFPTHLWGLLQLVITELIIGMILGLMVQFFFEGIRLMGQTIGYQTGFAITNILDPQSGVQVSILANLAYYVAIVLFLLFNGHHVVIAAMKESFEIIQIGSLDLPREVLQTIIRLSGDMFLIALKIGAPAIAALLFTMVAFGLITKLIPQMNIMIVAFPVKIVLGLFFFGICLGVLSIFIENYVEDMGPMLIHTMEWLNG